ncbi:MAG: stage II sporulation protein R [Oliverpabstia sp.]
MIVRSSNVRLSKCRKKKYFYTAGILVICICMVVLGSPSHKEQEIQEKIAGEILRFRVVANSDSVSDQETKQKVKNALQSELGKILENTGSLEVTKEQILGQMDRIDQTAKTAAGTKQIKVSLTEDWFPQRIYGKYTFPEGEYETLRVEIGEGKGHNWWCVLYPGLCYGDAVHPVTDEEGEEQLKKVLDEESYDFLLYPAKTRIRFRWF